MEEVEKKAREDLEAEQARSRGLSDDIDRLKKALQEKEDAILQLGKLIEDLRVNKMELTPLTRKSRRPTPTSLEKTCLLKRRSMVGLLCSYVFFVSAV